MFCTKCGKKILEADFFCGNCGKKLKHEDSPDMQPDKNVAALNNNTENNINANISENMEEVAENTMETVPEVSAVERYDKIGGFLVLLAIGLFIAPFTYVIDIADSIKVISSGDFQLFKDAFKNFMYFNITSSVSLFIFLFFLLFSFLHKKQNFPKLMAIYFVLNISIGVIILVLIDKIGLSNLLESKDLQDMSASLFKSFIAAIIWIPYLFISKRAKGTFVN